MNMEVADDAWMSLLPDLLLEIFRRMQTTPLIRSACTCKTWRRIIISNASTLRLHPDRYNPNLLLGFFHEEGALNPWPPRFIVSVADGDMGKSERLSSLIPAVDEPLSQIQRILSSRDGFLLLLVRRGSNPKELCLCNPMARDCTFFPLPSITKEEEVSEYTIVSSSDGAVRILVKAVMSGNDRLTYQVYSFDIGGGGAGIWGPVQRSGEVNKGLLMHTYGRNAVVGADDNVHWLAGPPLCNSHITCTVGLDINTGRAWTRELPSQCQFFYTRPTVSALTTSTDGRLSLLQPLPDNHIQVWVLDSDGDIMEWTVQHKISIVVQNDPGDDIMGSHYLNAICPSSGFLLIALFRGLQLRISMDSQCRHPVQCIGKSSRYQRYFPYKMDWSTYISNMKNF